MTDDVGDFLSALKRLLNIAQELSPNADHGKNAPTFRA